MNIQTTYYADSNETEYNVFIDSELVGYIVENHDEALYCAYSKIDSDDEDFDCSLVTEDYDEALSFVMGE